MGAHNKGGQIARPQSAGVMATTYTSGPIPDASQLERYDMVCPGAADRIITMAEKQSKHRQDIEKKVVTASSRDSLLGLLAAFIIGIVTTVFGGVLILKSHDAAGTIFGGVGLSSLVGTFVYGTRSSRRERESKNKTQ